MDNLPDDLETFLNSSVSEVVDENGEPGVTFDPSDRQLQDWEETLKDLDNATPVGIVPVSTLSEVELSARYNEVKEALLKRGEALSQTTQTGRDLQSERAALLIEMARRGLR